MYIPFHLQTIKLSYGWVKEIERISDEQSKGMERYSCKLYPTRDCWGRWTIIKTQLQLEEVLGQNLGLPHNPEELTLNCAPYDPIPLMPQELRELHALQARTMDTQRRHKSKKSEKLGRCGRQDMLWPYLKHTAGLDTIFVQI